MNHRHLLLPFLLFYVLFFSPESHSQQGQWDWLFNNYFVNASADDGDYLWLATTHGLIKLNKLTGEKEYITSMNSGISEDNVLSIAIDKDNVKWLALENKIAKFDGSSWTFYDGTAFGLYNCPTRTIIVDADNIKWFAVFGGLVKFDGSKWTKYDNSNSGLPDNWVNSVCIDNKNVKWVATEKGIASFDGTTWKTYKPSVHLGPGYDDLKKMVIDRNNIKWAITNKDGLARFDGNKWEIYSSDNSDLPHNLSYFIAVDYDNMLWVGTAAGLCSFDGTNWKLYGDSSSILRRKVIGSIVVDKSNVKWFATLKDDFVDTISYLIRFDGSNWTYIRNQNSPLPDNYYYDYLNYVKVDHNNRKWFGTAGGGIYSLQDREWNIHRSSVCTYSMRNSIREITVDKDNVAWCIISNIGLLSIKGNTQTLFTPSNSQLSSSFIYSIASDRNNIKWIGTTKGLFSFDGVNMKGYNTGNSGLTEDTIFSIAVDSNNSKWMCAGGSVLKYDESSWTVYNSTNSILPASGIFHIIIDSNGVKWFITYTGLVSFDGSNWRLYNKSNSGLPDDFVLSLAMDKDNLIWISTLTGLVTFDGTTWKTINNEYNLSSTQAINGIAVDKDNNKWLSNRLGIIIHNKNGLVCVEKEQMNSMARRLSLISNYPNPFNPETRIAYIIPENSFVTLRIYDILGKEIQVLVNEEKSAGEYNIRFNAEGLSSGVYIYRLQAGNYTSSGKMMLLR